MQERSKVESYIGFAMRANKYRCGAHAISTLKQIELLILCHTAENNSQVLVKKLARKFGVKIVVSNKKKIEDICNKEHCKIMAILDKSLSNAILDNLNEDFTELEY